MNPFFEQIWEDAHARLIAYFCDELQPQLPPDLVARAEEGIGMLSTTEPLRNCRPGVAVSEPWKLKEGGTAVAPEPPIVADQPVRILHGENTERWVEIRDAGGRVISVLELLSPGNKRGGGVDDYLHKRRGFIAARVNLVEIDFVRQGTSVFPGRVLAALERSSACYGVCVFRAAEPLADEVYPVALRDRLPSIRVPLRDTDADVVLSLQRLINQCHERGRYHMLSYTVEPEPPFSPADAAWVDQLLRLADLRR